MTSLKNLPYKVLLNELVSVNFEDKFISSVDKWTAHTHKYLSEQQSMPHRAFSIFLFNSENKLLFQKRSVDKKTFPLCWTNTCCSHPNMIQVPVLKRSQSDGSVPSNESKKEVENIRAALHRALDRELKMDLTKEKFYLVDKILYKSFGAKNQQFGEYEVDYVFLCKLNTKNIKHQLVKEEVAEAEWIGRQQLDSWMKIKIEKQGSYFSPWFSKMKENGLLDQWWNSAQTGQLKDEGQGAHIKVRNYL